MANKTALLKSYYDENATDEEKLHMLGENTGNLVFWNALIRLFNPTIISYSESAKLKDFDRVIITDLIWIRENVDFDYLERLVDTYDIPFIPMSIGLQSPTFNPDFKLSENTVRLLKKLEKRATLGVRGYYTASILKKYGITNFSVIGCPSMYYWNNPNLKINEAEKPKKASCNFRSFYGKLSRIEKHFLTYCANKKMQFVEQTKHDLKLEHTSDVKYFNYVNKWLTESKQIFYDFKSWSKGLKDIDFSIGGRFHGNVIALQNGIKSLFLTVDSRTKEMTDFFRLPAITMSRFDATKSLDYYFSLADYSKFNAIYPALFKNFVKFAENNGLVFDKHATPLNFVPKKINKPERDIKPLSKLEEIVYDPSNIITIKTKKKENRISYEINVQGQWERCFFFDSEYFIEYDQNIENCPDSVAIIPILSTLLPVSWVEDATIIVDDIDEDFYESIEQIKENYRFMIPEMDFKGKIIAHKITKNNVNYMFNKTLCLYSGGVDATTTLLRNINYKPAIMTIWGTDIYLNNVDAWNKVKEENEITARQFGIPFTYLKSSFRRLLNESFLTETYAKRVNGSWWHEFQHGINLICLVAPYAYLNNYCNIKIASSFSAKDYEKFTCASLPYIDENVSFCGCNVYHDGFYLSRMDKIRYILRYAQKYNKKFKLRVCWQEITGENCCVCEKCARTLFSIIANGANPSNFGFNITKEIEEELIKKLKNGIFRKSVFWVEIKEFAIKNKEKIKDNVLAMALIEKSKF